MQYKFNCCNMIAPAAKNHGRLQECPTCGKQNPIVEEVDKEDRVFIMPAPPGDSFDIKKYQTHRVRASGLNDLVILEIQTGVCQEDDIIRIEDDYGRV